MGDVVPFPTRSTGDDEKRCWRCVHSGEDGAYCWLVKEHLLFDVAADCETYEEDVDERA